jgi:DNA repair photolyase
MPLILQPVFSQKSREEIEQHLLVVRAKRMSAVVVYFAGVNAKNMHLIAKEQQRIAREYEMLKRDIDRMGKLEVAIEARLAKLIQHQQEMDVYSGNLVEIEDGDRAEKISRINGEDRRRAKKGSGLGVRSGRAPGT